VTITEMSPHFSRGTRLVASLLIFTWGIKSQQIKTPIAGTDYLSNNTVLIIRHAEKPPVGNELTPAGYARAQAYVHYFEPFREDHLHIAVDALYAGADSDSSIRPRQTLEPLSKATGLKLDTTVSTKAPGQLVTLLRTELHGTHPLIAWRHGQMPALLAAFGAPPTLLPNGKWPDDVFDWVVILRFNRAAKLQSAHLVKEHLVIRTADGGVNDHLTTSSAVPSTTAPVE